MTTSSTINTLLLPPHILNSTPSWRYDNIEPNEETLHRVFGCELIQEAGILLRMSQAVMATGQHLLHRFYYRYILPTRVYFHIYIFFYIHVNHSTCCRIHKRKSLKRFDVFTVSMGCFLLASKLEEKPKILREVLELIITLVAVPVAVMTYFYYK